MSRTRSLFSRWFPAVMGVFALAAAALGIAGATPGDDAGRAEAVARMVADLHQKFPGVPNVAVAEARGWIGRDDVVFVDVREPGEQAVSMIPGARPASEVEAALREDPAAFSGKTLVAYCTIGHRSSEWVAAHAPKLPQGARALNLEGSLLTWTHAEAPLLHNDAPTRRVHVYGPRWNLAPTSYEAVW